MGTENVLGAKVQSRMDLYIVREFFWLFQRGEPCLCRIPWRWGNFWRGHGSGEKADQHGVTYIQICNLPQLF